MLTLCEGIMEEMSHDDRSQIEQRQANFARQVGRIEDAHLERVTTIWMIKQLYLNLVMRSRLLQLKATITKNLNVTT